MTGFNPYPGLRPFEAAEAYLYFGRDEQRDELLRRLQRHRFVAVVGPSGSGKSSLVRAGLMTDLHGGFMVPAGSQWKVSCLKPGGDPLGNLARTLKACLYNDARMDTTEGTQAGFFVGATLRRGPLGLTEAVRLGGLRSGENLLLLVDQFEEIFRYRQAASVHDHSAAFVRLLLEATRQHDIPIYIVLTMRSDYLGECAHFRALPEAINSGLYLIPRMTRNQLRQAITGPAAVAGSELESPLIQCLLNEAGEDPDQLPVLQHALRRTWEEWRKSQSNSTPPGLEHYQAVGGMAKALSRHADEAYQELPDDKSRRIAESVFKRLTEKGDNHAAVRRPTSFEELCKVAQGEQGEVEQVIDAFRRPDRSFLTSSHPKLEGTAFIDISHESLMRVWERLSQWVDEETESARQYIRLVQRAEEQAKKGLMVGRELSVYLKWREDQCPQKAWAERYAPSSFDGTMAFLDKSQKARQEAWRQKEARRRRRLMRAYGLAFLFLSLGLIVGLLWQLAESRREQALASGLAAQAELERPKAPAQLQLSTLLALESARRLPNPEAEQTLRQNLSLLPLPASPLVDQGRVADVAFSADGALLAAAEGNRVLVWGWDAPRPRGAAKILRHPERVLAIAFSPDDSQSLAAASGDSVWLWDLNPQGDPTSRRFPQQSRIFDVAFSKDGTVAAADYRMTRLWDASTGQVALSLQDSAARALAFHPQNAALLATAEGDRAIVWDLQSGQILKEFKHDDRVNAIAFSKDGSLLATASSDRSARVWEWPSGRQAARLEHGSQAVRSSLDDALSLESNGEVLDVAFSPDGQFLATASSDLTARVWGKSSWSGNDASEDFRMIHQSVVNSAAFSPDSKYLATGSVDPSPGWIWELSRGDQAGRMTHQHSVTELAFSPEGRYLATATSGDKTARVWEAAANDREVFEVTAPGPVDALRLAPNGQSLLALGPDGFLQAQWTPTGGIRELRRSEVPPDWAKVALSPQGDYWAAASQYGSPASLREAGFTVRVWRTADGEQVAGGVEGLHPLSALAVGPGGAYLATAEMGVPRNQGDFSAPAVSLWRLAEGRVDGRHRFEVEASCLAFSPDGRYLAAAGHGSAWVWRAESGQRVAVLAPPRQVVSIAFDPGSTRLTTVSGSQMVQVGGLLLSTSGGEALVWEVGSGRQVARIASQEGLNQAAFSPDGSLLATAGSDGVARIWRWRTKDLIFEACRRMTRNLSQEEWSEFLPGEPYRKTRSDLPAALPPD